MIIERTTGVTKDFLCPTYRWILKIKIVPKGMGKNWMILKVNSRNTLTLKPRVSKSSM